jgi:hypothetical protein
MTSTVQLAARSAASACAWRFDVGGIAGPAHVRPNLWCVTDGGAWAMNDQGTNTMRTGMNTAVQRWAGRVNTRVGITTPPPS